MLFAGVHFPEFLTFHIGFIKQKLMKSYVNKLDLIQIASTEDRICCGNIGTAELRVYHSSSKSSRISRRSGVVVTEAAEYSEYVTVVAEYED